ncbi:SLATT domain-containing protein [Prosthecobacter dejongeii]|uniref:SMODS and SLOG-associating 2TM effector domain-containing protein n=1 Tax=Prosthecobacter dejongeii TaxID=48465 RepID=A0A7W7YII9_9BACT|nr:SLATT domain-containing protein [Prosthecobacter dejongeii]MBB5036779.1 hypothetical protein [Prosthecobacter dejongeii]
MTKPDLQKQIAQAGYNVGYGAKLHLATFDLAAKVPGFISFLTFAVGLYFLLLDFTAKKYFSATCIILGVIGWRVSTWDSRKDEYSKVGSKLTGLFNSLKALYYEVKASDSPDVSSFSSRLEELQNEYNSTCLSNQMLFSDWYAHYKFFWQHQIDWIDGELHFKLFRDKLPLSFMAAVVVLILCVIGIFIWHFATGSCGLCLNGYQLANEGSCRAV